jgi:hypothetical protein
MKGDIPSPRAGHAMATFSGVLGTSVVLFGGKDDNTYYNDFYILDISNITLERNV